jgi:CheY-like chemotaxis protein
MMPAGGAILIAEDSEDDRYLLAEAVRKARIISPVQFVNDGKQAVAYLSGTEGFADRTKHPLPGLVILDYKMPFMNGIEVLQWIRASDFKRLPVIILSASSLAGDIERAYDLHVNSYLMKPSSLDTLVLLMQALSDYWLVFNEYPHAP